MRTDYDITMDKTKEGGLICHVIRTPVVLYTLEAKPEGGKYRLLTVISPTERIDHGLVDNGAGAERNLVRMAQQYAMSHVVVRAGDRR